MQFFDCKVKSIAFVIQLSNHKQSLASIECITVDLMHPNASKAPRLGWQEQQYKDTIVIRLFINSESKY